MKIFALGVALCLTAACAGASAVESMAIVQELTAKGVKAAQDADDLFERERPQAALVVLRRHVNDVDKAIATVEQHPEITEGDRARVLAHLRQYRADIQDTVDRMRTLVNLSAELESP